MKYTDRLNKIAIKFNVSFSLNILLIILVLHGQYQVYKVSQNYLNLDEKLSNALKNARVILSPAVTAREVIDRGSIVSDSYIQSLATHVVGQLEAWTYETMESDYNILFKQYYDHTLENKSRADLSSSNRYQTVKDKHMVSIWKWNYRDRASAKTEPLEIDGEFTWCEAIGRACALVSGKSTIYIGHNQPYKTEDKTYFLLAKDIYPTKKNPFSLRVTRLVVGNKEEMRQLMAAAKSGSLKDV